MTRLITYSWKKTKNKLIQCVYLHERSLWYGKVFSVEELPQDFTLRRKPIPARHKATLAWSRSHECVGLPESATIKAEYRTFFIRPF